MRYTQSMRLIINEEKNITDDSQFIRQMSFYKLLSLTPDSQICHEISK